MPPEAFSAGHWRQCRRALRNYPGQIELPTPPGGNARSLGKREPAVMPMGVVARLPTLPEGNRIRLYMAGPMRLMNPPKSAYGSRHRPT